MDTIEELLVDLRQKVLASPQACRLLMAGCSGWPDPRRRLAFVWQWPYPLQEALDDAERMTPDEAAAKVAATEARHQAEWAESEARMHAEHAERTKLYERGSALDSVIAAARESA